MVYNYKQNSGLTHLPLKNIQVIQMNAWWDQCDSLCQPTTNTPLNFVSSPVSRRRAVFILLQIYVCKMKYAL